MINTERRLMTQSLSSQLLLDKCLLKLQVVQILNSLLSSMSDSKVNIGSASRMEQIRSRSSSRTKNNLQELRPPRIHIELYSTEFQYYRSKSCHKTGAAQVPSLSPSQEKVKLSKARTAQHFPLEHQEPIENS